MPSNRPPRIKKRNSKIYTLLVYKKKKSKKAIISKKNESGIKVVNNTTKTDRAKDKVIGKGIGKSIGKGIGKSIGKGIGKATRKDKGIGKGKGFILFRHKYCDGEALDFGIPTNDGDFGTAAIKKTLTNRRKQSINGIITELQMILQGPQDDKFEKRQNRLNFLNQVNLFSELVILYDKLQYFLNGGDIEGQDNFSVCVITSGGNIITIFANLLILIKNGMINDIITILPDINIETIVLQVNSLFEVQNVYALTNQLAAELQVT